MKLDESIAIDIQDNFFGLRLDPYHADDFLQWLDDNGYVIVKKEE